jgi:hypothetical protein
MAEPSDEEAARAAAEAAEGLVFSRYSRSDVDDLDVTVSFEEGVLEVDVYLNVGDGDGNGDGKAERVAEDAVRAAEAAVDDLFGVGERAE